jgi:hypothetical protein
LRQSAESYWGAHVHERESFGASCQPRDKQRSRMTPELHLQTCFLLNVDDRIVSTREPAGVAGPIFALVRGSASCAWAVRADVPLKVARELEAIARDEPPTRDFRAPPVHEGRYLSVLGSIQRVSTSAGPAFSFPETAVEFTEAVQIEIESLLEPNFRGWVRGEITAGRGPVLGIVRDGYPVSVCFCARRTDSAAEAGLETARPYRRSGFGATVTAAWASALRATGRVPLYSTSWGNEASLGVARKLGLIAYASYWNAAEPSRGLPNELQRTLMDKVPSHMRQHAAAEQER